MYPKLYYVKHTEKQSLKDSIISNCPNCYSILPFGGAMETDDSFKAYILSKNCFFPKSLLFLCNSITLLHTVLLGKFLF